MIVDPFKNTNFDDLDNVFATIIRDHLSLDAGYQGNNETDEIKTKLEERAKKVLSDIQDQISNIISDKKLLIKHKICVEYNYCKAGLSIDQIVALIIDTLLIGIGFIVPTITVALYIYRKKYLDVICNC